MKIRTLLFCGALVAMGASCKGDETKNIDQAAESVKDKSEDLGEQAEAAGERTEDVAHTSADLASAQADFTTRRDTYVSALRGRLHLFESQSAIAGGLLADTTLTENDRAEATEKVGVLEREIAEAEQAVDALATSTAAQWDSAADTCNDAFDQLSSAHDEAFDSLSADRKIVPPETKPY